MPRNISKPFNMTLSLIDIEPLKPKYKCFFGEDVQLNITVTDENRQPLDLSQMSARVYYICDGMDLRQDDNITITDTMRGRLKVIVKRNYIRVGTNDVRVVLYDDDQEIMLQPATILCKATDISDVNPPPEDPAFDYKTEILKVKNTSVNNQTNIGDISTLKTTVKSDLVAGINELKDSIETNTSQLEQKAEKVYVDTKIGNMGNTKTFKGSCLYSALPITATVDDYWYVTDRTTNYCWNGTVWVDIGNNLNIGEKTIGGKQIKDKEISPRNISGVDTTTVSFSIGGDGYVNSTTGSIVTGDNRWEYTDYIDISTIEFLAINKSDSSSNTGAFYTIDKKYLKEVSKMVINDEFTILEKPKNASYIRLSKLKSSVLEIFNCSNVISWLKINNQNLKDEIVKENNLDSELYNKLFIQTNVLTTYKIVGTNATTGQDITTVNTRVSSDYIKNDNEILVEFNNTDDMKFNIVFFNKNETIAGNGLGETGFLTGYNKIKIDKGNYFKIVCGYTDNRTITDISPLISNVIIKTTEYFSKFNQNNKSKLYGKKFNIIGDSYVYGHTLGVSKTWSNKLAVKHGMTYRNYGVNGNGLISSNGGTPVKTRYIDMDNDADYIGVIGGKNDYNTQLPLDTFRSGLDELCQGLIKKYLGKKIFFGTPWSIPDEEARSIKLIEYTKIIIEVCNKYGIPVFNASANSGIHMLIAEWRTKYCLTPDDISHLNELGMELVLPRYESFMETL